ncbi:MAG: serine protease [Alphaproteobacteria bacterium]|jgi:hypothetical protein|nr:serine protease [Alphaproteobacteria bacterium]
MRRLLITAALALGLLPTLARAQTDNRTLGGDDIPPTRWPIVAALLHGGAPGCGAVLIAESWVVTAAHCVYRNGAALEPAVLSVRFGTELPDSAAGEVVDVAEVVVHKDFAAPTPPPNNFSYFVNDIALLRLGRPVALAPAQLLGTTRAAALAAVGKPATAIGWGTLAEASAPTGTTILKQVAMTVAASGVCATTIAPRPYLAGMLCAEPQSATPAAADATCGGDAGGPLLLPNGRGGFVLAGILSGLRVDCTEPGPAIATAMPDYLDWIVARVPTLIVDGNVVESGFWGIDGAAAAGVAIEIQGSRLILGLMLYDAAGSPTWYFASGAFSGLGTFTAPLQEFADGSDMLYGAGLGTYQTLASPGTVTLTFQAADRARLTVAGRDWTIRRSDQIAGRPAPDAGLPETGWYRSRRDPGRFWFVEAQGARMMVADFAYGTARVDDHYPARWTIAAGTAAKVGTAAVMSAPIYGCVGGPGLKTTGGTASCGDTDFALSLMYPGVFTGWLIPDGSRAVAVGRYVAP